MHSRCFIYFTLGTKFPSIAYQRSGKFATRRDYSRNGSSAVPFFFNKTKISILSTLSDLENFHGCHTKI